MKIGNLDIDKGVLLAPMEGLTDLPFRIICRLQGADIVYSEFIASEALVRDSAKSRQKMVILDEEKPVAIQIFGSNPESMAASAKIIEESGADLVDINFGCWVKKVVNHNAGAAFLKDPASMARMTAEVARSVSIPVTIKTRLGWDKNSIVILDAAKMLEDAGAAAITLHCRTREMGMKGSADWSWIPRVKEVVSIPVILNGDVINAGDVSRAFSETGCDAVMIGRAAVGNPFIFRQSRQLLNDGILPQPPTVSEKIDICLEHLKLNVLYKGLPQGLIEFRKHYSGYLRGLYYSSNLRQRLVLTNSYDEVVELMNIYKELLLQEDPAVQDLTAIDQFPPS